MLQALPALCYRSWVNEFDSGMRPAAVAPPASAGLRAGSRRKRDAAVERQRRHPARPGPLTLVQTEALVAAAYDPEDTRTPAELAVDIGICANGKTAKRVIETAREKLAKRAEFYADAHAQVVRDALADGDPKALETARRAAEWALERVTEGGARVIDPPKGTSNGPALSIGIAVSGVPARGPAAFDPAPERVSLPAGPTLTEDSVDAELLP